MARKLPENVEFPLAALWRETAQAHFLRSLTMYEALAALEKRRDLAECLLSQVHREPVRSRSDDKASCMMLDHCLELLEAELAWLDRTISWLQSSASPAQ